MKSINWGIVTPYLTPSPTEVSIFVISHTCTYTTWSLVKATLLSETSVNEVDLVYYSVSKRQGVWGELPALPELHKETERWRVGGGEGRTGKGGEGASQLYPNCTRRRRGGGRGRGVGRTTAVNIPYLLKFPALSTGGFGLCPPI